MVVMISIDRIDSDKSAVQTLPDSSECSDLSRRLTVYSRTERSCLRVLMRICVTREVAQCFAHDGDRWFSVISPVLTTCLLRPCEEDALLLSRYLLSKDSIMHHKHFHHIENFLNQTMQSNMQNAMQVKAQSLRTFPYPLLNVPSTSAGSA